MKKLLAATFLLFSALCLSTPAQTVLKGRVTAVVDGDTIAILDASGIQERARLQGIDAPEQDQPFGAQAKSHLSLLTFGKEVVAECDKRDRYGRFVCKVMRGDVDVCEAMLWAGLAWHYKEYQNEQSEADRKRYASVEVVAKESGLGLWADAAAVAPWKHRHSSTVEAWKRTATPVVTDVATTTQGSILGNRNSGIYHWPGCPNYSDIAADNRVPFTSREEAEKAGYRAAKNCPTQTTTQADNNTSAPASTGGTVNVRGYYRKDGTYVRPHTRSAPRKKN